MQRLFQPSVDRLYLRHTVCHWRDGIRCCSGTDDHWESRDTADCIREHRCLDRKDWFYLLYQCQQNHNDII